MNYPGLTAFLLPLFVVAAAPAQEVFQSARLEKRWETPAVLKVPESALYDAGRKVIYVSNLVTQTGSKNGQGFIAKLSPAGEVIANPWIMGLHEPKGMALLGSKLYVSSLDELVEIDVDRGVIVNRYPVEKAQDLNDVTVASDGTVYVTDTKARYVFMLKDGRTGVFLESDDIARSNGIFCDGERLYVHGRGGRLLEIDRATRAVKVLTEKTGYIDGLVKVGDGRFLTSDWAGVVQLVEVGKPVEKLLDTKPKKINAADLGWIAAESTILVPTFNDNRVVAYRLK